jgi:hypothetical protein
MEREICVQWDDEGKVEGLVREIGFGAVREDFEGLLEWGMLEGWNNSCRLVGRRDLYRELSKDEFRGTCGL